MGFFRKQRRSFHCDAPTTTETPFSSASKAFLDPRTIELYSGGSGREFSRAQKYNKRLRR